MKNLILLILLTALTSATKQAYAQTAEVTQLILNIEKLNQLRQILKEIKSGYGILFKGYNTIKNLSEKNFKLHRTYLDGLLKVNPTIKKYKRISDIVAFQLILVNEYKVAYHHLVESNQFQSEELNYLESVHSKLIHDSVKQLGALTNVLTDKKLRMSDYERLTAIDAIYDDMQQKVLFLRHFNQSNAILTIQRVKEMNDIKAKKQLFDLN